LCSECYEKAREDLLKTTFVTLKTLEKKIEYYGILLENLQLSLPGSSPPHVSQSLIEELSSLKESYDNALSSKRSFDPVINQLHNLKLIILKT
jgi:hypothetical protein